MRLSLLAACSLWLCGCLSFPEDGAYRCDGPPAPGCTDQCFCLDASPPPLDDRINFLFSSRYGQDLWVVGLNGRLWRRKNGDWTSHANLGQKLYGGWGRDPGGLVVVGENGLLMEAGEDEVLHPVPTGIPEALTAVWTGPLDEGWAVGQDGVMFHRNDLGWSAFTPSPATTTLNAVYGYYANVVWAVGAGGKAFRFDGSSWTDHSPPITSELLGVWVSRAGVAWVVGAGGASARFDPESATWTNIPGASVDLVAISGSNPDEVWAGGAAGSVFHYEHGAWVQAHNLSTETEATYGVWSLFAGDLWVGSGTTLEHRHP
jgi:hypothetical protein